jgi:hypothetical protein
MRPLAPFGEWPVQVETDHFFFWYVKPCAFVSQAKAKHGTLTMAREVTDHIQKIFIACAADVHTAGGLLIIHDFRSFESADQDARDHINKRTRERAKGLVRGGATAISLNPVLRIAVRAAGTIAALSKGHVIEVVSEPSGALKKHEVERPPPGSRFPGL